MMATTKVAPVFVVVAVVLLFPTAAPASMELGGHAVPQFSLAPMSGTGQPSAKAPSLVRFAFVDNFENLKLSPWSVLSGAKPTVGFQGNSNYSGEPTLTSSASRGLQFDYVFGMIGRNEPWLSLQVAIDAGKSSSGFFGLSTTDHVVVALVGVQNGTVVAGSNLASLTSIEKVPKKTAQPPGWVYFAVNVSLTPSTPTMTVFVDSTQKAAATVNVPNARRYADLTIETTFGSVHYSDIIATTNPIAIVIKGYNNMEGYGQGSALYVTTLPEFDNYTATMTLDSWSVPQSGILSFQINAMNLTGTVNSTCTGFFQLGLSLDTGNNITPWYVPGKNCESTNFVNSVSTPPGSTLELSILWESSAHKILFRIVDTTIGVTWQHAISYKGGGFYGAYTQMEFQPCCNNHPIADYALTGSLSDMVVTELNGTVSPLSAGYMLPFLLDAPPSWDLTPYFGATASYVQISR